MLKVICSLMALVFILSILYSNKVESRIIHQNYEGMPILQRHHLHFDDDDQNNEGNHDETNQDQYAPVKRKSDFLLSLYGLPYTLVNKRDAN